MKPLIEFLLVTTLVFVAGCSAIDGIFKAGMWVGGILALGTLGITAVILLRTKNNK